MEEKMSFFKAYGRMWNKIFNYRDSASKREFWLPLLGNAIICAIAFATNIAAYYTVSDALIIIGWILTVYTCVTIVPMVSLTVRRLHDAGRSGWWTCLLLAVGVGTLWLLIMCASSATGGGFNPYYNQDVDVYGPPAWDNYNPADNELATVYGPPEWFEEEYDASENEEADVYGPPEWEYENSETDGENGEADTEADAEDDAADAMSGADGDNNTDEDYDPENNIVEPVYGPPAWEE